MNQKSTSRQLCKVGDRTPPPQARQLCSQTKLPRAQLNRARALVGASGRTSGCEVGMILAACWVC